MGKNKLKKFTEMETFSNVFQPPYKPMAGHWRDTYFHNDNPIVLELGCGRGEYTVGLAQRYPDKNFIGVDIKGARMWAGAKEAEEMGLQMKKATKRLTSTYFMQRYQQIMKPSGLIHLKTDSPFLYTYTTEMLRLNPYPVLASTDDLYADTGNGQMVNDQIVNYFEDARALKTHYEKQWLDRGMKIKYIVWRLTPLTQWEEPTIEIEKDSYRSYGRNYQAL